MSTCASTLRHAQQTVGSRERLAELLGVTLHDLESWIRGTKLAPGYVFLRALDLAYGGTSPVSAPTSDSSLND